MKKLFSLIMILGLLGGCATPTVYIKPDFEQLNIKRVAVIPFECADETIGLTATDIFMSEFLTLHMFEVIERSQLNKVLEEQKLGFTGTLDTNTIKNIGKILGVDAIVAGSVYPNYRYEEIPFAPLPDKEIESIRLDVRLLDVEKGTVLWSGSQNSKNVFFAVATTPDEHIRVAAKDIIKALRKGLEGKE